ncbi:Allergen Asp f 4 [Cladobotryum mycophilum]|uniref:Allergen Asp f 4 n=1 Tax=Cladobotryum mycophilum TaxID=491253 RepID=A0ABR0SYZ6_9HYPO
MKFSATAVLFTAALGVSAHPSGHGHVNAHPVPQPPAPAPAVPKPAPQSGSSSQGAGPGQFVEFCSGPGKRATLGQISYKGNVGKNGVYGCNIMPVQKSIADKYQYTLNFINKSGQDQTCAIWNKIGDTNEINGFFVGKGAKTFQLPAGGQQVIALDTNSQGGAACGPGGVPTTSFGQYAGTWVEYDVGNLSNGGWSGFDASCLVAAANKLSIPALSVCLDGKCSTVNAGGSGDNAYLGGMEDLDGVGLNVPPGPAHVTVNVGGQ